MNDEVVRKETKLQKRRQIDRQRRTDRRGQKRRNDIVHPTPTSSYSKEFYVLNHDGAVVVGCGCASGNFKV